MTRTDRIATATYDLLVRLARERGWRGTTATKVRADEVRLAFHEAVNGQFGDDQPEEMLSECVDLLCGRGVLRPMAATNRERVPLARGFHLEPIVRVLRPEVPPAPIWHRALYDLDKHWQDANPLRRARYAAVNKWLKSNADRTPVPVRERCLDVFASFGSAECHQDAEKTLDGKTTAALFGEEDRLMKLLSTFRVPPPLLSETVLEETGGGYRRVGAGDVLLVLENSTTWWSVVEVLGGISAHRVGHVAWGLGTSFVRSVRSIAERHHVAEVRYFGDLDLSGIRIPAQAAAVAREAGLPPVVPAVHLYDSLLRLGLPAPSREASAAERVQPHLSWLAGKHRRAVEDLLSTGSRLAQEWVGLRHLSTTTDWQADLR
ncbi:Wadjet anti-phage system protein JetD domain-containing protein [Amycolatopsis sp. NPDC059090]|uniref:Wadjet anti-phage system protein JetD domain-containing protein n=1 Tax=unclassified Amycolatopsis TaxID=2618356 RepID=UPI00366B1B3C